MKDLRKEFLETVVDYIEYWEKQESDKRQALEGLAFSIMVVIDNCGASNTRYQLTANEKAIGGYCVNEELHDELCKLLRGNK